MLKTTQEHLNRFQQEHEVYLDAQDLKTYWAVTARIPKKGDLAHRSHRARKYITARTEGGSVLILPNPHLADVYFVENWGEMGSFDEFIEKALVRILEDKEETDRGEEEVCGASCS